jgi:SAM-dependent methyltransferase
VSSDPFLARLKARAAEAAAPPEATAKAPEATPREESGARSRSRPRREPRDPTAYRDRRAVAFWQSEVVRAFVNRRITGDEQIPPSRYFADLVDAPLRAGAAIVLRGGDPALTCELLRHDACARATIVDGSQERLDYARARLPDDLRARIELVLADPLDYSPPVPPSAVVAVSALHRLPDPDAAVARIARLLAPGGLLYVDEFVGPDRFQWAERQVEIVNRLLACLPEELRRDLTDRSLKTIKEEIGRPDPERFSRDHPEEAVAPSRIRAALDAHLEPVVVKPYGGAVFHQFFARIMGNFLRRPELVRLLLEFDAILTDSEAIDSDYLWAVYRRPVTEDQAERR